MSDEPKINKTHASVTGKGSALKKYQDVVVGSHSSLFTFYFEICMFLAYVPGALGILLRQIFWPKLFGSCGKGVAFAYGIVLRHPRKIHLGNRVVISERCTLDARSGYTNDVIILRDDVILSNDIVLSCKEGKIELGARTGVGAQTIIHSRIDCNVYTGEDTLIGPRCFLTAGGSYNTDRIDIPVSRQGKKKDGDIVLKDGVWLGANVTVLGKVIIKKGTIVGVSSVVTKSLPEYSICLGVPAKFVMTRKNNTEKE